jgi:hypothetical protein
MIGFYKARRIFLTTATVEAATKAPAAIKVWMIILGPPVAARTPYILMIPFAFQKEGLGPPLCLLFEN